MKEIFSFITRHILPLLSGPAPPASDDLLTGQSANHSLSVKHLHDPVYLEWDCVAMETGVWRLCFRWTCVSSSAECVCGGEDTGEHVCHTHLTCQLQVHLLLFIIIIIIINVICINEDV